MAAALYEFVKLPYYKDKELRASIQARCDAIDITGTLLLVEEGINGILLVRVKT